MGQGIDQTGMGTSDADYQSRGCSDPQGHFIIHGIRPNSLGIQGKWSLDTFFGINFVWY